jgi:hypothetical protein
VRAREEIMTTEQNSEARREGKLQHEIEKIEKVMGVTLGQVDVPRLLAYAKSIGLKIDKLDQRDMKRSLVFAVATKMTEDLKKDGAQAFIECACGGITRAAIDVCPFCGFQDPTIEWSNPAIHEACAAFPEMGEDEFGHLVESMRAGYDPGHPVVLFHGEILDGRHKAKAAHQLGLTPTTIEYTGNDPWGFAWSANGARRNLTPSQRARIFLAVQQKSGRWNPAANAKAESLSARRDDATGR